MESSISMQENNMKPVVLAHKATKRKNSFKNPRRLGTREHEAITEDHQNDEERKIKRNKNSDQEEAVDSAKELEIKKRKRDQEAVKFLLEEEVRLAVLLEKKNKRKRGEEENFAVLLEKKKIQKEQKAAAENLAKNQKRLRGEQEGKAAQDLENKNTKRKRNQELSLERKKKRQEEVVCISDTDHATTSEPSTENKTREETLEGHKKRKSGAMMEDDVKFVTKKRSYTRRNLVKGSENEDHPVEVLYDIPGPIPDLDELLMEFNSNDQLFRNFFVGVPESD